MTTSAPFTTYEFRDASTEPVSKTLLIAMAGPTGGGKTESAMRVARGLVGPQGKFCVIDTENRRALNKKNRYRFGHLDLQPPYSPENFEGAIRVAAREGYGAIIIDSFSAEWDAEGGLSDDADEILEKMSKGDARMAERIVALSWKAPKKRHKKFMAFLRKSNVPIILCLRAEPKIKFVKEVDAKTGREVTKVIDAGWLPIAEKMLGYDMMIYALMMAENPGIPVHLKKLEPDFEPMFPLGKQVSEECGQHLAAWVAGIQEATQPSHPGTITHPPSPKKGHGLGVAESAALAQILEKMKVVVGMEGEADVRQEETRLLQQQIFGTRSWTKIQALPIADLEAGLKKLLAMPVSAEGPDTEAAWAALEERSRAIGWTGLMWSGAREHLGYADVLAEIVALEPDQTQRELEV